MKIAAEFKRASPSKGDLNIQANVITQCVGYAEAGASVISVLTDTKYFKGKKKKKK
jgi:indole-3-glycerol phosphate synthase